MFQTLIKKVFGSRNERVLKQFNQVVKDINALEDSIQALDDTALRAKTAEFKARLAQGEKLDALLPEAFAVVREVSKRTLGMRHFDVQLIGGLTLHKGKIAEMRTGEGKTLMATLAAYLNALTGQGVHVVTVNDYLASRDAAWMAPVYEFLGLQVGVIMADMEHDAKKKAYAADIVYGTNNEFGFDYLRDNMAFSQEDKVQRELHFAVVDEVDSILIDEARTPLIISGQADDSSELYKKINILIPNLEQQEEEEGPGDFTVDEKQKQAYLSEAGHQKIERLLIQAKVLDEGDSLYAAHNIALMHHIGAALRAHVLFQKDVDYIVANNEVVIVDEHTGRTMPGRRWSEGLHQAIEAKEGVSIQNENQTLASITFQNYFRLYDKLSGMTGTADTEAYEFQQIYNLEVLVIPTNKPMIRDDAADLVYLSQHDKYHAIIEDIKLCVQRVQPVLVGTASIEASEILSSLLNKANISHKVLNAKFHEKEASIVSGAGRPGQVTIATNMAGRGTDIVLGGSLESELLALGDNATDEQKQALKTEWQQRHAQVLQSGGLRIIGSERHESRRIDNQLRGRSGRQGDPGSSRFYLSLEDNLLRIFAPERIKGIMQKLGMKPGEAIEHKWITKAIENAQRKVEGHNFDIRKQLLEYDNVANDQRKVIYELRNEILQKDTIESLISEVRIRVIHKLIDGFIPPESLEEQWEVPGLEQQLQRDFGLRLEISKWLDSEKDLHEENLRQRILDEVLKVYKAKQELAGEDVLRQFEKAAMLQTLDTQWREHLASMDHLRQGIHLRGYAQKDPKQEYKRESFLLFEAMLDSLQYEVISLLATVQVQAPEDVNAMEEERRRLLPQHMEYQHNSFTGLADMPESAEQAMAMNEGDPLEQPFVRHQPKVGRNDACPCGSGKKFKQCHGKIN